MPGWSRGATRAAVCAATFCAALHTRAAEVDAPPALPGMVWEVPPECPDGAALAVRLRDALDGELLASGRDWQIHGRVSGGGAQPWRLVLELREPNVAAGAAPRQRTLRANRCDDLVEAAAVAIALALSDAQGPAAARETHDDGLASSSKQEAAARSSPPRSRGEGAGPPADQPTAGSGSGRSQPHLELSLGGVLDSASVAGWAFGGSVDARLWLGDIGFGLQGLWLPPHGRTIAPGQGAEFSLLAAGARGCYAPLGGGTRVRAAACAGFELGRFSADSRGLIAARDVHDAWLAPSAGLDILARLFGVLALSSRLDLAWPLRRQEYRVDLDRSVHNTPNLTVRWTVAIGGDVRLR